RRCRSLLAVVPTHSRWESDRRPNPARIRRARRGTALHLVARFGYRRVAQWLGGPPPTVRAPLARTSRAPRAADGGKAVTDSERFVADHFCTMTAKLGETDVETFKIMAASFMISCLSVDKAQTREQLGVASAHALRAACILFGRIAREGRTVE